MSARLLSWKSAAQNEASAEQPHMTGDARCVSCGFTFMAVCPVGETWLPCPECKAEKALLRYPCNPPEGEKLWHCSCECQVFYITPQEIRCYNCGALQSFP